MVRLLFFLLIFITSYAQAQTPKQIKKAIKAYNKSASKGIAKIEKYIKKAPNFGNNNGWETLIKMEFRQYSQLKEMFEGMTIAVENEEESDSANLATSNLMKSTFLDNNEQSFVNVCRRAAIMSSSPLADFYLRKLLVDFEPDSLIGDTAKAYFEEGESFFLKKDFELARLNYRKAIATDNDYYKAVLYLGDSFWNEENYDSAIYYFSIAKELQPELLEPRKFLIDALMGNELWVRAKEECLDAFCVYPSNGIKFRYMNILKQENKWLYTKNIKRDFFANNMADSAQAALLNPYNTYREAKNKTDYNYNIDGIIEAEKRQSNRYLEVNSWRYFLSRNDDNLPRIFRFAKKMEQENYLDCYVFFSFFHVDIYPQFKDFMSDVRNRERMKTFITTYMVDQF